MDVRRIKSDVVNGLSRVSTFVTASMFSTFVLAIQGIIVIKMMPPELMGVWLTLQLIYMYGVQFHLGILNAVNREIPYYLGKKDTGESRHIENVARGNLTVLSLVIATGLVILYRLELFDNTFNVGVFAIGMSTIVSLNMQLYVGIFKARSEFNKAAIVSIFEAVAMLLGLPFVYLFLLDGLIARSVIVSLILFFTCLWLYRWNFKIEFRRETTIKLLQVGAPIMLLGYGIVLLHSMDRLLIALFMGSEAMGHYALSVSVYSFVGLFPALIGQVYYPKMVKHYAEFGISNVLVRDCIMASVISVAAVCATVIILLFVLPWAVLEYFPDYVKGIPAMKVSLVGVSILAFIAGPSYFLIATNQKRKQGVILAISIVIMYFLGSSFVAYGLTGIAWSLAISLMSYVVGLWIIVLRSKRVV